MPAPRPQASEQRKTDKRDRRSRHTNDPALTRPGFATQHFLHKLLSARHLAEALLIRSDAPYFVVRQRSALITSRPLHGVESVDFPLKTSRVPCGILEDLAVGGTEKACRAEPGSRLRPSRSRSEFVSLGKRPRSSKQLEAQVGNQLGGAQPGPFTPEGLAEERVIRNAADGGPRYD